MALRYSDCLVESAGRFRGIRHGVGGWRCIHLAVRAFRIPPDEFLLLYSSAGGGCLRASAKCIAMYLRTGGRVAAGRQHATPQATALSDAKLSRAALHSQPRESEQKAPHFADFFSWLGTNMCPIPRCNIELETDDEDHLKARICIRSKAGWWDFKPRLFFLLLSVLFSFYFKNIGIFFSLSTSETKWNSFATINNFFNEIR